MAGRDGFGIRNCRLAEFLVAGVHIGFDADQTGAGGFVESDRKFDSGHGVDNDFVEILGGFDEMRLAQDEIGVLRNAHPHRQDFHFLSPDGKKFPHLEYVSRGRLRLRKKAFKNAHYAHEA
jgi:hypothetical protein